MKEWLGWIDETICFLVVMSVPIGISFLVFAALMGWMS